VARVDGIVENAGYFQVIVTMFFYVGGIRKVSMKICGNQISF